MPYFTMPATDATLKIHSGDIGVTYDEGIDKIELFSLTGIKVGSIPPSFLHCLGFEQLLQDITAAIDNNRQPELHEAHIPGIIEGGLS